MIRAQAPLRISFVGGGTDLPAYADEYGGMVISAAISLYAIATARCSLPATPLMKACLEEARERGWTEAVIPPRARADVSPGTGLGSSSAVAVAALAALKGNADDPAELAEAACAVELERLQAPIGKQDQYASAYGGVNVIRFEPGGVTVRPLVESLTAQHSLSLWERRLLLFATGQSRNAGDILKRQTQALRLDPIARNRLHHIRQLAEDFKAALLAGDLDYAAAILDVGWHEKRAIVPGIATDLVSRAYVTARRAGAKAGKLCGAGGGGHLLLYAHEDAQPVVISALQELGLTHVPFRFEPKGVSVETDL